MAVSSESATVTVPLLQDTVDGVVDSKGRPAKRSATGGWRSASFIIGVEVAERFAYYGVGSNLISYLTGPLAQSTATAAVNVNAWSGTAFILPLFGAFVADSFLGRYRTIIIASLLYVLGLGLLTLSAFLPVPISSNCGSGEESMPCRSNELQVLCFFFSLYLIAVAQGGHKPCVQAFGADQFDEQDPNESRAKGSFFNWWYFGLCASTSCSLIFLSYIQDNLSWALGFGIPCIAMAVALVVFLLGTTTYRFGSKGDVESPFVRIGRVFLAAARNWQTEHLMIATDEEARGTLPHKGSEQFKTAKQAVRECHLFVTGSMYYAFCNKFLNKALIAPDGSKKCGKVCCLTDVEEAKSVLRLVPIWATCLVYAIVFAQSSTLFTKQGVTMDRSTGLGFDISPASLQSFITSSVVLFIPIYDCIFVPFARTITGKPSGITMLQRIGTGMLLMAITMVIAAIVENERLEVAKEHGLVDMPMVPVPMSAWWLVPQYVVFGVADMLTMVGLQEFFYDQVPNELRSVGLALYLSIFGVGSFLSSFLISAIEKATGGDGRDSWFANNLNRAHLDYFYWLLAGLSAIELGAYLYFAKSYIYNRKSG